MGHLRSRFSTRLPAETPVHPHKISPKSFVKRILPLSPTGRGICRPNFAISFRNRNLQNAGGGEGVPNAPWKRSLLLHEDDAAHDGSAEYQEGGVHFAPHHG
jgi:hypothetical protein